MTGEQRRGGAGGGSAEGRRSDTRIVPLDRQVLENHLAELLAIDARAREELRDAYSHEQWGEAHFRAQRPDKWTLSRAAVRGDRLAGFLVASRDGAAVHVHRLAVAPEDRGGTGRLLMRASEDAARELGLRGATLSLGAANEGAIRFYRSAGYRPLAASGLARYAAERGLEIRGDRLRVSGSDYFVYEKAL